MNCFLKLFILSCFFSLPVTGQVFPGEGDTLNYRLTGFLFGNEQRANDYRLEIAAGRHMSQKLFKQHVIKTVSSPERRVVATLPAFGYEYTWRVVYTNIAGQEKVSSLHHFSVGYCSEIDTTKMRIRIVRQADSYKDAYVFFDGNRVLYDMDGNPIWYLPGFKDPNATLRDLKISPWGTITCLLGEDILEVDYNGKVLWKGPNDGKVGMDITEHYHHEFTRLKSGHYMVLGDELPLAKQKVRLEKSWNTDSVLHDISFGTVIEYDEQGKLIWYWRSSDYFLSSDIVFFNRQAFNRLTADVVHENAFYFDESDSAIYISFRHISRILKIKYPSGVVLNTYGEVYRKDVPAKGSGIFCGQHSCRRSSDGYLYFFNNGCNSAMAPKVTIVEEGKEGSNNLTVKWEYSCTTEGFSPNHKVSWFPIYGSVKELPDSSFLVCSGSDFSKVFIVDRRKTELWSAIPEKYNPNEKTWNNLSQYRSSIIMREEIDKLIWKDRSVR